MERQTQIFSSEQDIINSARQGDISSFETLYRNNVGRVYAVCLRIVADSNRAEELTQEVFIQAWEKLPLFRGESLFSTWLHKIAVNFALGEIRSDKRYRQRVETTDDIELYDDIGGQISPEDSIDLEDAIKLLPPQARAIFVLHDIEGYRHEEIGEQLGIATGTSKAQLHRARKLLKEVLER